MVSSSSSDVTGQLDSLMEDNMGLVVLVAKSFNPRNEDELDEYVQLGRIGMWKAIKKHDPSRAKLSTLIYHYARWEILRFLKKRDNPEIQLEESFSLEDNLVIDSVIWELLPDCLSCYERDVIKLRLQGYTFLDIGKELGYSRGWANNTYRTALQKIKDANEEETDTDG